MTDASATRVLIPHIDDVACAHGANVAMFDLAASGAITCGSVMVPPAWFPDAARRSRSVSVDLGVHLTLTSESEAFRWSPISTSDRASGLIDADGYLWPRVQALRAHGDPEAVDRELRAQIDRALQAGIDVTHLDHHMGAALAPEFVTVTAAIARDYSLPILFPADIAGYVAVLDMGPVDLRPMAAARADLAQNGLAIADTFLMGLTYQTEPDAAATLRREITALKPGVTYLSLHCALAGDIDVIHPDDAHWRIAEFELFRDAAFGAWVRERPIEIRGMRSFRDMVRER